MPFSLLQYNILSLVLLLPVVLNLFAWNNARISALFGGLFVVFQSLILGQLLIKNRTLSTQFVFGLLAFLTLLLLSSTAVYIFWDLSAPAQSLVFLLHPLFVSLILRFKDAPKQTRLEINEFGWRHLQFKRGAWILFVSYGLSLLAGFILLFVSSTSESITSPWQVVSPAFWPLLALSTVLIILISWTTDSRSASPYFIGSYLLLLFSVALIVYKIGYGFDSFIHQTAEQLISSNGFVLPKTPYYLGQYSLVVSLSRLLGTSVLMIDRLLVPLLAALSLPFLSAEILQQNGATQPGLRRGAWLAAAFVMMPFASFVVTTPQSLANLYFLWIVLCSFPLLLNSNVPWNLPMLWLLALSAMAIHPLSGIPAIILTALVWLESMRDKLRIPGWMLKSLYLETFILGSLALPACFLLLGLWSDQSSVLRSLANINLATIKDWLPFESFASLRSPRPVSYEFGYYIVDHIWWLLSAMVVPVMLWLVAKSRHSLLRVYLLAALIILANAFLLSAFVELPNVISYEANQYPARLVSLAFWSLSPFLIIGLLWLYRSLRQQNLVAFWMLSLAITWVILGNVYATYPRQNRYEIGRQYSASSHDFEAVRKIAEINSAPYVVLSNQSVSAAAVATNGFKTYYPDPSGGQAIFYYPLPTSSPLYKIYLDMVYQSPSRKNAEQAQALTGAHSVYFVLNDYWENAEKIKALAKMEADEWMDFGNGSVTVFTYRFEPEGPRP